MFRLEVYSENCMLMSQEHSEGQICKIEIGNKSFERVEQFKYFGNILKDKNCVHIEHSGNDC